MTGTSEPEFQIHTFDITELETMYEIVEEKYLEERILDMAKYVIGDGSSTEDGEI